MEPDGKVDVEHISALERLANGAAAVWAEAFVIESAAFTAHLVACVPPDASAHVVAQLHAADLYLACACGLGIPAALARFEAILQPEATVALQRMRLQPSEIDDICQMTREKVLVGGGGRPAAIAGYTGRGPLRGWLRVVAIRVALNALRGRQAEVPLEHALIVAAADRCDSALSYADVGYASALTRALERAVRTLTTEDRVLLRQRFLDGLLPAQIGVLHRKHRVTILRQLKRILRTIRSRTEEFLQSELGCAHSTAISIVHAALLQARLSIRRHLAPESANH